jgi:hypothetical protein
LGGRRPAGAEADDNGAGPQCSFRYPRATRPLVNRSVDQVSHPWSFNIQCSTPRGEGLRTHALIITNRPIKPLQSERQRSHPGFKYFSGVQSVRVQYTLPSSHTKVEQIYHDEDQMLRRIRWRSSLLRPMASHGAVDQKELDYVFRPLGLRVCLSGGFAAVCPTNEDCPTLLPSWISWVQHSEYST